MNRNEKEHVHLFNKLAALETNMKWLLALNSGIFLAIAGTYIKGGLSG